MRYDNTADLFSKMSEAGFSDIASTLCVDPEQQTSKEPVPLSMNPGGRLIKDTFWRVPISSHVSGIIGYYALIDKETESLL